MKNYYKILGVSKKASPSEIKKAYYKLARKHHPDRGGNEERFKEINEAYQILSDKKKRKQYDSFGRTFDGAGPGQGFNTQWNWGGSGIGFGGFEDFDMGEILNEIFGGRRGGPFQERDIRKGSDLKIKISLSLEDILQDTEKEIPLKKKVVCPRCSGVGGEPGTEVKECFSCRGTGKVQKIKRTILGTFTETSVCPECDGEGYRPEKPCNVCKGKGRIEGEEKVDIVIPAGVDNNQVIKIKGKGGAGIKGGKAGDLYISFFIKEHPDFKRKGDDLYLTKEINFSQAALGDKIKVKTIDGKKILLKIPQGLQSGRILKISKKGIPHFGGRGRGDLFVQLIIKTPRKLTKKQKELLKKFKEENL